ncbi:MAG: flagellar hook basal-body protein, partial [Deltaproteobacteria bacterium]
DAPTARRNREGVIMGHGIYVALSGAIAQATALETTATNLANASTDGYQRLRPVFHEVLSRASAGRTDGLHYTANASAPVDPSAGARRATGGSLDAALPEGTYLAVSTPRGERYTRACSLSFAPDGALRNASGAAIVGERGEPIVVRGDTRGATLGSDGSVRNRDGVQIARLRTVSFARPEQLRPEGNTVLSATAGAGAAQVSAATIDVGAVEESNASIVQAMTELVSVTRRFEAFQRAIDTFREADRRVVTVPSVSG